MYDGVAPHLIHKNLTKFVEDNVTKGIADADADEDEPDIDIKDFLISVRSITKATAETTTN